MSTLLKSFHLSTLFTIRKYIEMFMRNEDVNLHENFLYINSKTARTQKKKKYAKVKKKIAKNDEYIYMHFYLLILLL